MAELVTVTLVCDNEDLHPEEPVRGERHRVVIDGDPYDIETCKPCEERIFGLIRSLGRPERTPRRDRVGAANVLELAPTAAAVAPGKVVKPRTERNKRTAPGEPSYPCLWCEHTPYGTSTGLSMHLDSHGLPNTIRDAYGLTCPLCGVEAEWKLGLHMMTDHGGLTVPEAFRLALNEGDPQNVVKPILDKATR